tara:strand:- start:1599 stop:1892 length:294 start_codon:yes stop_codon:yes gene_type:complete
MPGFFDAIKNMPAPQEQKPKVVIGGKQYEVSLEMFKEVIKHGENQYHVKDGVIVRKPPEKITYNYSLLEKSEKGYKLMDNNLHWPTDIVDGGYEWTR